MAKLKTSVEVPLAPEVAWEHASDLSRMGDWLSMHKGWRSELPAELRAGVTVVSVAQVKGMANRVTWKIDAYDPPRKVVLKGEGKGGTKYTLELSVKPSAAGSTLELEINLGGPALFGPIGATAARALKGDIQKSLDKFVELFAT